MKLLDLFSGIGGFSLGAEYNNIETIGFVEKDAFCQKVLRKHWPNTPIIGNIRDVTKDTFESVDIVSGGFPCQPFSVAGKRKGTDDDRYLWDETIRVVSLYKPRWFVGENVEGIVNIQNGMVLRQVQDDLEKEGFEVQCGIIPASGIGAWHQRKRVWILGYSQHNGSPTTKEQRGNTQTAAGSQKGENSPLQSERASRPTDNGNVSNTHDSRDRASRHGSQREREKNAKEGQDRSQFESSRHSKNDVSNSQHQRWSDQSSRGYRELGEKSREKEKRGDQSAFCSTTCSSERGTDKDVPNTEILRPRRRSSQKCTIKKRKLQQTKQKRNSFWSEAKRCSSQDDTATWWQTQSKLCGVPNGVSYQLDKNRVNQIKSLGNSIVPQIACQIFKAIKTAEQEK